MNHTSTLVVMFSALLCASMLRPTTAQDPVEANEPHLVDVMTAGDNFTGGAVFRAWSDGTIDYRVSDSTHCRDMGDVRVLLGPAGRAESTLVAADRGFGPTIIQLWDDGTVDVIKFKPSEDPCSFVLVDVSAVITPIHLVRLRLQLW